MVFIDSLDVHSPYIPYIPYVSYSSVFPVRKRDGDPWNLPCSQLLSWACQANRFDKFQRSLGYKNGKFFWQVLGTFSEMALAQRPVVWRRKSQWINGTYLQIKNHQHSHSNHSWSQPLVFVWRLPVAFCAQGEDLGPRLWRAPSRPH